jgi:hypothetical protein
MLEFAMPDAGGPDYEAAIGDGTGYGVERFRALQEGGGADGGAGFPESDVVGTHDPEAGKPEVRHRAGGSADIERVARGNQDYAEVVFPVGSDTFDPSSTGVTAV